MTASCAQQYAQAAAAEAQTRPDRHARCIHDYDGARAPGQQATARTGGSDQTQPDLRSGRAGRIWSQRKARRQADLVAAEGAAAGARRPWRS
eukprot:scaffold8718_cov159-Isochrysis_galbana.AAC.10